MKCHFLGKTGALQSQTQSNCENLHRVFRTMCQQQADLHGGEAPGWCSAGCGGGWGGFFTTVLFTSDRFRKRRNILVT